MTKAFLVRMAIIIISTMVATMIAVPILGRLLVKIDNFLVAQIQAFFIMLL